MKTTQSPKSRQRGVLSQLAPTRLSPSLRKAWKSPKIRTSHVSQIYDDIGVWGECQFGADGRSVVRSISRGLEWRPHAVPKNKKNRSGHYFFVLGSICSLTGDKSRPSCKPDVGNFHHSSQNARGSPGIHSNRYQKTRKNEVFWSKAAFLWCFLVLWLVPKTTSGDRWGPWILATDHPGPPNLQLGVIDIF